MRKLFLIPARGGSKGLPRKNVLPLAGRPMIYYTLDAAKESANKGDEICVSTDDDEIIGAVQNYGLEVPFVRPAELASDTASSSDVLKHALNWYEKRGDKFDLVILLQPTSPFRTGKHIKEALNHWSNELDMVVSVKETDSNPYYVLFEEGQDGTLKRSKPSNFTRRQDCPVVYELNGAIYIFSIKAFKEKGFGNLDKMKKYVMSKYDSIDVDDIIDFKLAELTLKQRKSDKNVLGIAKIVFSL